MFLPSLTLKPKILMPRIILQGENLNLDTSNTNNTVNNYLSDRDVLKQRSKKYIDLVTGLDAKTLSGTKGMTELMSAIQEEFGTADLISLPIGIVSKCFLGDPFEVHILDLTRSQIIRHFKTSEAMEPEFEKARTAAMHNAYAVVEVYKDKIILIREDGTAIKL